MRWLILKYLWAGVLFAQTTEPVEVSGRVVNSITGDPVQNAVISANCLGEVTGGTARSGQSGEFTITVKLQKGCSLNAQKQGFELEVREVEIPNEAAKPRLEVALTPLGSINGSVTNAAGEPVPEATVMAWSPVVVGTKRYLAAVAKAEVDDRGRYVLGGLHAGLYYLHVAEQTRARRVVGELSPGPSRNVLKSVYFGGSARASEASVISLQPGDRKQADFVIDFASSYSVSGSIVGWEPGEDAAIWTMSADGEIIFANKMVNASRRGFLVDNLPDGEYIIEAVLSRGGTQRRGRTLVTVQGKAIAGLSIAVREKSEILVKAHRDQSAGGQKALSGDAARRLPGLELRSSGEFLGPHLAKMAGHPTEDGTYRFEGIAAGSYELEFAKRGAYLTSILVDGRPHPIGQSIEIDPSSPPGIEIGFREANSKVSGKAPAGCEAGQCLVMAIPLDPAGHYQWTMGFRDYTLHGLPPGEYLLLAWKSSSSRTTRFPELDPARQKQGTRIHVADGENLTVDITRLALVHR